MENLLSRVGQLLLMKWKDDLQREIAVILKVARMQGKNMRICRALNRDLVKMLPVEEFFGSRITLKLLGAFMLSR